MHKNKLMVALFGLILKILCCPNYCIAGIATGTFTIPIQNYGAQSSQNGAKVNSYNQGIYKTGANQVTSEYANVGFKNFHNGYISNTGQSNAYMFQKNSENTPSHKSLPQNYAPVTGIYTSPNPGTVYAPATPNYNNNNHPVNVNHYQYTPLPQYSQNPPVQPTTLFAYKNRFINQDYQNPNNNNIYPQNDFDYPDFHQDPQIANPNPPLIPNTNFDTNFNFRSERVFPEKSRKNETALEKLVLGRNQNPSQNSNSNATRPSNQNTGFNNLATVQPINVLHLLSSLFTTAQPPTTTIPTQTTTIATPQNNISGSTNSTPFNNFENQQFLFPTIFSGLTNSPLFSNSNNGFPPVQSNNLVQQPQSINNPFGNFGPPPPSQQQEPENGFNPFFRQEGPPEGPYISEFDDRYNELIQSPGPSQQQQIPFGVQQSSPPLPIQSFPYSRNFQSNGFQSRMQTQQATSASSFIPEDFYEVKTMPPCAYNVDGSLRNDGACVETKK